jgi:hypothetical protein
MIGANHHNRKVTATIKAVGVDDKIRLVRLHFCAKHGALFVAVAGYDAAFCWAAEGFSAVAAFTFISCHQNHRCLG